MTSTNIQEGFNLDNPEHQARVPTLVSNIIARVDDFVTNGLAPHVDRFGAIPFNLLENSHHHHKKPVFDMFIGSYGDTAADRDLLDLEWAIHRLSLGPWDGPDIAADRQVALEQMIPITTRYAIAGKESPLQLARDWLHSQSCYYADYLAHIRLVEHGNVVARLNDIGARYMLEPGRNYVRIVLSNGDVAATIGREFW